MKHPCGEGKFFMNCKRRIDISKPLADGNGNKVKIIEWVNEYYLKVKFEDCSYAEYMRCGHHHSPHIDEPCDLINIED
jgi:hypothetical protein